MRYLIHLSLITFLLGCASKQLKGTWFVIEDEELEYQGHYRSLYYFHKDSLIINQMGAGQIFFKIISSKDNLLIMDSLPDLKYEFDHDTLKLEWPQTKLKLLPFNPISSDQSKEALVEILKKNTWKYKYEGVEFTATFLNRELRKDIRYAEIDIYYDNKYQQSMDVPHWTVENYGKQNIIIIEDIFDDHYANVFFVKSVEGKKIITESWLDGIKYDVIFSPEKLIDSVNLLKRHRYLTNTWVLRLAKKREEEVINDDTTLMVLGQIKMDEPVDTHTIIKESDLTGNRLIFDFKPDSSYLVTLENNVICKGRWHLQRNGSIVRLFTKTHFRDEYQIELEAFKIKELDQESLKMEQWIPVYENDSTIPSNYYELNFIRKRSR